MADTKAGTTADMPESMLGERRLFFSGAERDAMVVADEQANAASTAAAVRDEPRKKRSESTVEADLQPPPASARMIVINGFIEATDSLTFFINGQPCKSVSLASKYPQKLDCPRMSERMTEPLSIARVDARQFTLEKSDGEVIVIER